MSARTDARPIIPNPLARLAEAVPARLAWAVSVAAKLAGLGFAIWYAYGQDALFPSEHFPRTWAFVGLVGAVAIASLTPWCHRLSGFVAALGAGALLFGGANLADRRTGLAAMVCGVVAWLAVASWNHRRGVGAWSSVAGLFAAAGLFFVAAIGIALVIEN